SLLVVFIDPLYLATYSLSLHDALPIYIFNFGTQKSQEMDFAYTDENGQKQYVHLGSYGIGVTRLIGVLAEKFADERGLVWPDVRSEEHTSELQSRENLVCRLLLEKKN